MKISLPLYRFVNPNHDKPEKVEPMQIENYNKQFNDTADNVIKSINKQLKDIDNQQKIEEQANNKKFNL